MADGHDRARWNHTSMLCALIANCHRDPRKNSPFAPEDFNPCAEKQTADVIDVNDDTIGLLRQAFT